MGSAYVVADSSPTNGQVYLSSLKPWPTNIGHLATHQQQAIICALHESDRLQLSARNDRFGWYIRTEGGVVIGVLSDKQTEEMKKHNIIPGSFQFQPSEVTLGALYHHIKTDPITGEIIEDWFVPVPQIRVFRR